MKTLLLRSALLGMASTMLFCQTISAQIVPDEKTMEYNTAEWTGERTTDGRPKVPDELLVRLKNISIEEAWGVLRAEGYHNQFEDGWVMLRPDEAFVGRALTAQYMPLRPDINKRILE